MMKYWKELNELESAIYEVKSIQAGLNILCETEEFTCYSPSGISQSHQTFVIDLNERFDTAMEKLNERFQRVWDTIRDDTGRLGAAEEDDEEFTNEDIAAINDLVKDHEASIRFDKILADLPEMKIVKDEVYLNTDDTMLFAGAGQPVYTVAGAMDDQFSFSFDSTNTENFEMKFDIDPVVSDR